MSTTIGDLVDRVYREYLETPDNLISYTYLDTAITDTTTTTISFDGNLLSIEEEDLLDAGTVIEIGKELMYCKSINTVDNTVTVERGVKGTTATTHAIGD